MAAPLSDYNARRDFARTPEPRGVADASGSRRFVIHKHSATADHYDLRLELDGVLKCWAVPKGPSLDPREKRYAAQTEDHPVAYLDFEGIIPEGEYGAGPMIVWDRGEWAPMGDVAAALKSGDFKFRLWGEKLKGGWMLVKLKGKAADDADGWLLFKERDESADRKSDVLVERPESVKSGLTIEELAQAAQKKPVARRRPAGKIKGAVAAPMPTSAKPQLATQIAAPIAAESGWVHEIKFDGYRTLAFVEGGKTRFLTRAGLDWTAKYGALGGAFAAIGAKQAIIDGEVVVLDEAGVSRFEALQAALSAGQTSQLTFFAFDLLYCDGYDLTGARLGDRRAALEAVLQPAISARSALQFSSGFDGDARPLYDRASELGLEGIVSKRFDALYVQARTDSWVKVKARRTGDFLVVGYTRSPGNDGIGALALGEEINGEIVYRGKCGTGFSATELVDLEARLAPLAADAVRLERMPREVIAVRPVHVAHVHYANLTSDGSLRHAVYKGLRTPDLSPADSDAPQRKRLISDDDLANIWVTNPKRRLFGKTGATKLDVAIYYAAVGDFMLPHILGRPVSLVRSPTGQADDLFFQRHPFTGMPASIGRFETKSSDDGEVRTYISVEDAKGYLALAQFNVIEFHTWGCHWRDALEMPDRITFDLDPGEGIGFARIVDAAFIAKGVLEAAGLTAFVKTSGGKGIHVVVPLLPKLGWKPAQAGAAALADRIAAAEPALFVVNMAKSKRDKKIFIDIHRNHRGSTAAAPYTLRARPNLPASTPVNWSDLRSIDAPSDLNYSTLPGILQQTGDPWAAMDRAAVDFGAVLDKLK